MSDNTAMTQWEVAEKMPRYDDIREFEVWINGHVRRVRRIGNKSTYLAPGVLAFTDCTHPMQNVICDEKQVEGWRVALSEET